MWSLVVGSALAQAVVVDDAVLTADAVLPDGVGSPSVVYDATRQRFLMVFETAAAAPAGCHEGWAIGGAVSSDGTSWRRLGRPLLQASPEAPCGPRHPSLVKQDDGALVVAFTATDVAVDGVGLATWEAGARTVWRVQALDGLSEPALARHDGTWQLLGVDPVEGVVSAHSTDLTVWEVDSSAVVPTGATSWSGDGVFSPALDCIDGDPVFPWSLHYAGWSGVEAAWASSVGDTVGNYYVSSAIDTWAVDAAWISFDVVHATSGAFVWFEHLGTDGLPRIGFATLDAPLSTEVVDRDCHSTP